MSTAYHEAIIRAAREAGIDPSAALAIAQRESNFDPHARSSKTIAGMFQMRGDLRQQYGVGDSTDPYEQAKGWSTFFGDVKKQMSSKLGRNVTDPESYLGHHFGAGRAAQMMMMHPETPVSSVFSPYERSINPHFDRAGTVGNLLGSVTSDIGRRQKTFGGAVAPIDVSGLEPVEAKPIDVSGLEPVETPQSAPAAPPKPVAAPPKIDVSGLEPVA